MIRKGFKMKLYPGMEKEYEKRHKELWPEMQEMIREYGGRNYSIFLDKETLTLFGYIRWESNLPSDIRSARMRRDSDKYYAGKAGPNPAPRLASES